MASFRLPLAHEDFAGQILAEFFPEGLASLGRPDKRQSKWVSLRGELKAASSQAQARLKAALADLGARQLSLKPFKKLDWARQYKSRFPIQIIGRIAIVPKWKQKQAPKGKLPILLTPGQGFGTGLHPTTRLVLKRLAGNKLQVAGGRVLDVGAGSGILGFGALRLGAKAVMAIEAEEAAVDEIVANRTLNGFKPAQLKALLGYFPKALRGRDKFDVICANIITPVLETLMPALKARLSKDGLLLLSGIHTESEAKRILRAIKSRALKGKVVGKAGNWFVIEAKK